MEASVDTKTISETPISSDTVREWFYIDSTGRQRGPLSAEVLLKMLEKGLIDSSALLWRQGQENWSLLKDTEPYKPLAEFLISQWYYIDADGAQKGPVLSK